MAKVNFNAIDRVVGQQLVHASRIAYEFEGTVDVSCGDLELLFVQGDVVHLKAAPNGEGLRIEDEVWRDSFEPPLSPENERFVAESGKHVRIDADRSASPRGLIGQVLARYFVIRNRFGTLAGVRLDFHSSSVRFLVECDESYVMEIDDPRFVDWGFTEEAANV